LQTDASERNSFIGPRWGNGAQETMEQGTKVIVEQQGFRAVTSLCHVMSSGRGNESAGGEPKKDPRRSTSRKYLQFQRRSGGIRMVGPQGSVNWNNYKMNQVVRKYTKKGVVTLQGRLPFIG